MKKRLLVMSVCVCALSVSAGRLPAEETAAKPAPTAPEMPEMAPAPEPALNPEDLLADPDEKRGARRMPTPEELEQVRKDRNWMVEGMKDKQAADAAQAKAQAKTTQNTPLADPGNTDMSQSIIDMVLNKKTAKKEPREKKETGKNPGFSSSSDPLKTFEPTLSGNAFENQFGEDAEKNNANSILQKERAAARKAGFVQRGQTPTGDPLANPFANLPIPEDALPQAKPPTVPTISSPAMATANTPPSAGNPSLGVMSGNIPSAAGAGNPGNPANAGNLQNPGALGPNGPTSGAPRMAVEQPYAILREQELVNRQKQINSNRPRVQDLRSTVPDPNEARLF